MSENGPGGREVGRVSLRVLPDTSKFLPSLKKYAERVERTVAIRLNATVDASGVEREAALLSQRVERTVPTIRVPVSPVSDGFARDLQTQVKAASKAIQANIPLTADGERFRRQIVTEVAKLEADIQRLDIEVPLDVESAARARAQLKGRVAELQLLATANGVEIPVTAGTGALGTGGAFGLNPQVVASLAAVATILAGGVIASLPALVASLAAPIAVIAAGMEGIKTAAKIAAPAFEAMRQAISNTFAQDLAGAFATLARVLPQITEPMERIASAMSGAFTTIIDQIASPEGLSALKGILDGIADAMEILAPALGPMTQLFLDIAQVGMQAFTDAAPGLRDALVAITGLFAYLNDSGVLKEAVDGFAAIVVGAVAVGGVIAAIAVTTTAGFTKIMEFADRVINKLVELGTAFLNLTAPVREAIGNIVGVISGLPQRVVSALGDMGDLLKASGAALIGGFIKGILSMLGPVGSAVAAVAQVVRDHFPGSPVKTGPLTSWNNGGAGKRLGEMLADGLNSSKETVRAASAGMAGAVVAPGLVGAATATGAAAGGVGGVTDALDFADTLTHAMRQTHLSVGVRETDRAITRHRNGRQAL